MALFRLRFNNVRMMAGACVLALCMASTAFAADRVIFLHYWTDALSGGVNEMVTTYNAKTPDANLKATGFEHESFKVGIRVMLDSGNPPDMFSYWAGARVQSLVDAGQLAPIDDLWKSANLDALFSPAVAAACEYDKKKYIIPVTQHFVAFFYNKHIFSKYNLSPPKSWAEFLAICETLKKNGVTPIALGTRHHWPGQFWFDFLLLRMTGPDLRNKLMQGGASYTAPEVISAMKIWRTLLKNQFFVENPNQFDWSEAAKYIHGGQAAMTLMGSWIIGLYDGQMGWKQGIDYDFFPFPIMNRNVPLCAAGPIDAIAIPKESRNKTKALPVLKFFTTTSAQEAMSLGSGALAPSLEVPASFYTPMQQRIRDAIKDAQYWIFPYDLATPPPVAKAGLRMFSNFLDSPDTYLQLLEEMEKSSQSYFSARPTARKNQ